MLAPASAFTLTLNFLSGLLFARDTLGPLTATRSAALGLYVARGSFSWLVLEPASSSLLGTRRLAGRPFGPVTLHLALTSPTAPSFSDAVGYGPIERLRAAGRALADTRDFPHPWSRPPFDRASEIDRLMCEVHHFAELTDAALLDARE